MPIARRVTVTLAAALAGAACDPGTAVVASAGAPITAGSPDSGDDGVAALLRDGEPTCSATLVAPAVLVTAAHCVDPAIAPTHAFFGAAPPTGEQIRVGDVHAHPAFDPIALADDIAVVLLAEPASAAPWPVPERALDLLPGTRLRLVGFGRTAADDQQPAGKRTGTTVIESATAADFRFGPDPSQTCLGDSGGPGFVDADGLEVLAGVTSAGDPDCTGFGRDTRVDLHVDGFLAPYLATDPAIGGCSAGGRRAGWLDALLVVAAAAVTRRRSGWRRSRGRSSRRRRGRACRGTGPGGAARCGPRRDRRRRRRSAR